MFKNIVSGATSWLGSSLQNNEETPKKEELGFYEYLNTLVTDDSTPVEGITPSENNQNLAEHNQINDQINNQARRILLEKPEEVKLEISQEVVTPANEPSGEIVPELSIADKIKDSMAIFHDQVSELSSLYIKLLEEKRLRFKLLEKNEPTLLELEECINSATEELASLKRQYERLLEEKYKNVPQSEPIAPPPPPPPGFVGFKNPNPYRQPTDMNNAWKEKMKRKNGDAPEQVQVSLEEVLKTRGSLRKCDPIIKVVEAPNGEVLKAKELLRKSDPGIRNAGSPSKIIPSKIAMSKSSEEEVF